MKIAISATNPCHLFPLAEALASLQALGCYYSGYPAWKLAAPAGLPVRTHSWRTLAVYGALKYLPEGWRPAGRQLFRWQDSGFDRWVGRALAPAEFLHAMPGQCRHSFAAARRQGVRTVLNHATGSVREWVEIMAPEYDRVGLRLEDVCPYDAAYFAQEAEEYALTDWHCAASSVVVEGLVRQGVPAHRIWQIPYGAEPTLWYPAATSIPAEPMRVVFAGQIGLRKGLQTLLEALTLAGNPTWRMDFYGAVLAEAQADLAAYRGSVPLQFHGAVSQATLAEAFRSASLLVLPSLEEGFGLVVPQALACGTPVVVSTRVGAKDLVRHRQNGSIFPVQDAPALAQELQWWAENPCRVAEAHPWRPLAEQLLTLSLAAC